MSPRTKNVLDEAYIAPEKASKNSLAHSLYGFNSLPTKESPRVDGNLP